MCTTDLNLTWASLDMLGMLFLFIHSLVLTGSNATVIRTFYLIPKKAGVIKKFEFSSQSDIQSEVSFEEEEPQSERTSWFQRKGSSQIGNIGGNNRFDHDGLNESVE